MGRVKDLWQAERDARWQQHFDDYIYNNCPIFHSPERYYSEAEQYANDMMEEEDEANGQFGVGA